MPKVTVVTLPAQTTALPKAAPAVSRPRRRIAWNAVFQGWRKLLSALVQRDSLLLNLLAVLLGRISLLGELAPFGLAFFTAVAKISPQKAPVVGFWAVVGALSGGYYIEACMYLTAMLVYFRFVDKLNAIAGKAHVIPALMFIVVLLGGLVLNLWQEATLYNALLAVFDATICLVSVYIFAQGVPVVINYESHRVTSENLICLVVLLAAAVAGLGDLLVGGYSLRNIVGSLVVMMLAFSGGAGLGTAIGVLVGLVVGLSAGDGSMAIALYSVAGLLAGTFRSLGKLAVLLGFGLGSTITILYFGEAVRLWPVLTEAAVAAVGFLVLPRAAIAHWSTFIHDAGYESVSREQALQSAINKLTNIAQTFHDLAGTFGSITACTREKLKEDDMARMLSALGEQVCRQCSRHNFCWEKDFYRTYQAVLEMLARAESGTLNTNSMPLLLKDSCLQRRELVETVNSLAEKNRHYSFWQKKIAESRQMITEQMRSTASIIDNLALEIAKQPIIDRRLASALQEKAALIDCPLTAVSVTGNKGAVTVQVEKHCCAGNRECINTILPLTASLLQEKLTLHAECGNVARQQKCKLTMQVANRFVVETGMASLAKLPQEASGDTYAVVPLNQGKVALMLSDGMGSGNKAADESGAAVRFLEKLLSVGFDVDVAVKTVNSLLLLRMPDETFATIDMAIIDVYSGEAEFLKVGSAPSFVKRVREVATIKSASPPIGILHQIEIEPIKSLLVPGDIIVMVSDGIADAQHSIDKDNWIANFLRRLATNNPQEIADSILEQAMVLTGSSVQDDMTVLVAKIIERPGLTHQS